MKRSIGATDLRQRLTDVLQAIRERHEVYIIETFGRPQAAIINLDEYEQFQRFQTEREAFFAWFDEAASHSAKHTIGLSEEEVLAIIEQAREALVQQIEQVAEEEQRSPEQIIREAMQLYVTRAQKTSSSSFLLSIAGIGRSGQKDVASRAEEILASEIDPQRGWSLDKDEVSSG